MSPESWLWTLGSIALTALAIFVHRKIAGWLPEDFPAPGRKRHPRPTPMVGFLPAIIAASVCLVADWPWLATAIFAASGVGLHDDISKRDGGPGVDWRLKSLGLLGASAAAVAHLATTSAQGADPWVLAGALLFVFSITNAANFLDNTNGVCVSLGTLGIWLAVDGQGPFAVLSLVWLGFVPFNWPRAHAFLGDAGAYGVGLCAATAAASAGLGERIDIWPALAPVAVLAADFVQVVLARLYLGFAPWVGDRRHLSHVLMNLGVPAVWVAPAFAALAIGADHLLRMVP